MTARVRGSAPAGARMSEDELLDGLLGAFAIAGWLAFHARRSDLAIATGSGALGFPDVIAVHAGRGELVAIECKADAGQLDRDQARWILALRGSSIRALVIRPATYDTALRAILSPAASWPADSA